MTARTQQRDARGWLLVFLAALVAVLPVVGLAGTALASSPGSAAAGAETRVGAFEVPGQVTVGPPERISAGQRLGQAATAPRTAVATGVAANAGAHVLPKALTGGPANTHVYLGIRDGKSVYTGITTSIGRRSSQHGSRFDGLEQLTTSPLTRGQARSVEQALIVRNGTGFENKINSISPTHSYYDDAVSWGESWLRQNGY